MLPKYFRFIPGIPGPITIWHWWEVITTHSTMSVRNTPFGDCIRDIVAAQAYPLIISGVPLPEPQQQDDVLATLHLLHDPIPGGHLDQLDVIVVVVAAAFGAVLLVAKVVWVVVQVLL